MQEIRGSKKKCSSPSLGAKEGVVEEDGDYFQEKVTRS